MASLPTQLKDLWPIERRVLEYLDQRGPTHRENVVVDLSSPDSAIGYRRDHKIGAVRGSNGNTPRIIGAGFFMLAGIMYAGAAITNHNKGWEADAFECTMWALGCAFVTVLLW